MNAKEVVLRGQLKPDIRTTDVIDLYDSFSFQDNGLPIFEYKTLILDKFFYIMSEKGIPEPVGLIIERNPRGKVLPGSYTFSSLRKMYSGVVFWRDNNMPIVVKSFIKCYSSANKETTGERAYYFDESFSLRAQGSHEHTSYGATSYYYIVGAIFG